MSVQRLMLILEAQNEEGFERTWLQPGGEALEFETSSGARSTLPLPPGAVQRVMQRYGEELSEELESEAANSRVSIALSDGSTLCTLRYRPRYDVIAKDYLVWRVPDRPSRVQLAVTVAAALAHLARALAPDAP